MTQEEPEFQASPKPTHPNAGDQPWKEHGPVALDSVPLADIDDADKTFQFRMPRVRKALGASLKDRGQINPIKVLAGEHGFRIIDGHGRVQEIKRLDWTHVRGLIYKGMSDREAMAISYESNVRRRNLSFVEKANAMQMAVNDGFTMGEVADLFQVKRRTVERYLELPEELRKHIDGKVVTMAHGRALKPLIGEVSSEAIGDLLNWIKESGASEKELRVRLKNKGLVDRCGKKKTFGVISNGTVRGYPFKIGLRSSLRDREEAIRFFEEAIERIRSLGVDDSGTNAIPT